MSVEGEGSDTWCMWNERDGYVVCRCTCVCQVYHQHRSIHIHHIHYTSSHPIHTPSHPTQHTHHPRCDQSLNSTLNSSVVHTTTQVHVGV